MTIYNDEVSDIFSLKDTVHSLLHAKSLNVK